MNDTYHEKYTSMGLVVKEKISVNEDSGEGMNALWGRLNTLHPGEEIIGGHLVPEALSESERSNENIKYFVIYGR